MIRSMTGFGRAEVSKHDRKFTVELKSVNHRYLELGIKMPKALGFFESSVRQELKNYIARGKVDVYISYENLAEHVGTVRYNRQLAGDYLKHLNEMAEEFGLENDIRVSTLSRFPDVLEMEEEQEDEDELWAELKEAVCKAAEELQNARKVEGEHLREDLTGKLDGMLKAVDFIDERSPEIIKEYREKIYARVKEILGERTVDEGRLLTEVTVFADKVCVDEEIVRLRSHIETMKKELTEGGSIGRKLDFIAQEMNREANTILSKTSDIEISNRGIELKTEIEKVREQIQNIE